MIILVCGSSLHHSLEKWRNISQRLRLSKQVITKPGYNLHPQTAVKSKALQRNVKFLPFSALPILWHNVINNSLTHSPSDLRTPLTPNELVNEVLKLQRVVAIVYCIRRGAPDIYKELKATGIPVLHIVNDLLSKRKSKDDRVLRSYSKLHKRPFLEIETLTIVRKYGSNLKTIIEKKQSTCQKQRRKNHSLKSIE